MIPQETSHPEVHHEALHTTFIGLAHPCSSKDAQIASFRGIKYASIPGRFRQSVLQRTYGLQTDASRYGPICPQLVKPHMTDEEVFGGVCEDEHLGQDEFECLSLNVTMPARRQTSLIPVMVWIHGGGDQGSGSHWTYDGGHLVRKGLVDGKPIMLVTLNYRVGLLGCAASPSLRDMNGLHGELGVGNYGLRDQQRALTWVHRFVEAFGGDPHNVTLFGEGTGGADVLSQMWSSHNASLSHPALFHRAIVQSALLEYNTPDVNSAGWTLSRTMSALRVTSVSQLQTVSVAKLLQAGHLTHATDDGVFFRASWKTIMTPEHAHERHHRLSEPLPAHGERPMQPLIIGDCSYSSLAWVAPASLWTPAAVIRRVKAICQSLSKSTELLQAYDIGYSTAPEDLMPNILNLINDARISWPTDCVAERLRLHQGSVWRYVFDQEGPTRSMPLHAADLMYLFDNVPLPASSSKSNASNLYDYEEPYSDSDDEDSEEGSSDGELSDARTYVADDAWALVPLVDQWTYNRVRDDVQARWIAFAYGESPWREEKVYVFGPEGEMGERSVSILEQRRRCRLWDASLVPIGMSLVQKVGVELSNGPC